jgi:hypothetical protein
MRLVQLLGSIAVALALTVGTAVVIGAHVDTAKVCAIDSGGHGGSGK